MSQSVLQLHPRKSQRLAGEADLPRRRCPMVRYAATWCRGLCLPVGGVGACGHLAPHGLLDRYQQAILNSRATRSA